MTYLVADKCLKLGLESVEYHSQGYLEASQHEAKQKNTRAELAQTTVGHYSSKIKCCLMAATIMKCIICVFLK